MTFEKQITVTARIDQIPVVTDFVQSNLERSDCSPVKISKVCIVLDEILNNISSYAYGKETGEVTVRLSIEDFPKSCSISFVDNGIQFNPLEKASPDTSLSLEEREIGGLGIHIVKKLMDSVAYEYKDGQNILTVKMNY